MITEKDYLNLKEMWDYQRMLEYNKDCLLYTSDAADEP